MNKLITPEDVISTIKYFCGANDGDEATVELIMAIGADLLNVSIDTINEMI